MSTYDETLNDSVVTTRTLSDKFLAKNTISKIITINSTLPLVHPTIIVNNNISLSNIIELEHIATLVSDILLVSSISDKRVDKEVLTNLISIINTTYGSLSGSITDSITFTSTLSYLLKQIEIISNAIVFAEDEADKVTFLNVISNILSLISTLDKSLYGSITDSLIIQQTIIDIHKIILSVIESISYTEVYRDSYIHILTISEGLVASNLLDSLLIGSNTIGELIVISLPGVSGQDTYLGYVYAPEGKTVSTYTNYNFDGSAVLNGKYLFFNSDGLYEYGDSTDDGSVIKSYIQTAGLTFGTSNLKIVPSLYLGYSTDNVLYLKVSVDGKGNVTYKLNKKTDNLGTKLIEIGKGLIGRYFQFELITEADEFHMESVEFMPIKLQRKL